MSPVGPLSDSASRKTLIYLILTLNHVYPDYDFSQARKGRGVCDRGQCSARGVVLVCGLCGGGVQVSWVVTHHQTSQH
jgi:hypothetical protein